VGDMPRSTRKVEAKCPTANEVGGMGEELKIWLFNRSRVANPAERWVWWRVAVGVVDCG
jgi:hypothetical protein